MYQVDGTQISFATYPAGAFGNALAGNSTQQINTTNFLSYANVTYAGFELSSCTSIGFKLAAS
jgi:hypothetical protein